MRPLSPAEIPPCLTCPGVRLTPSLLDARFSVSLASLSVRGSSGEIVRLVPACYAHFCRRPPDFLSVCQSACSLPSHPSDCS